mmetsp:Transcript_1460/g.4394  ORF Transcript_1460/g.4394 Transcript_1460/m.4394 type:complete len:309 (-) Transcript_1460:718-1644(-)
MSNWIAIEAVDVFCWEEDYAFSSADLNEERVRGVVVQRRYRASRGYPHTLRLRNFTCERSHQDLCIPKKQLHGQPGLHVPPFIRSVVQRWRASACIHLVQESIRLDKDPSAGRRELTSSYPRAGLVAVYKDIGRRHQDLDLVVEMTREVWQRPLLQSRPVRNTTSVNRCPGGRRRTLHPCRTVGLLNAKLGHDSNGRERILDVARAVPLAGEHVPKRGQPCLEVPSRLPCAGLTQPLSAQHGLVAVLSPKRQLLQEKVLCQGAHLVHDAPEECVLRFCPTCDLQRLEQELLPLGMRGTERLVTGHQVA